MDLFWEKPRWEEADKHLKELHGMPFQRPFPFVPEPGREPSLFIIRGPRQVGKTSWLKSVLSDHVQREVNCFYFSCEGIEDFRELRELLYSLRNRSTVLLDEVNYVRHWDRAVKQAIDAGETSLLMVTGSHSYDLNRGADRMPGRFGSGGEYVLLPMDFAEFQSARVQAGWSCDIHQDEVEAYFQIGGFPRAVAEAGAKQKAPKKSCEMLWRWISGDIVRLGRNEFFLTELFIQLALTMQTPVSFQTLAKKTSIASHTTVRDYIALLESVFSLRSLFYIDPNTRSFHPRKNRKFYFLDPLIYWMIFQVTGERVPESHQEQLAECVAHESLARKHKRFGYLANKKGEIDFVSPGEWALEVKWSESAANISKLFLSTTLPWKRVWTKGNFLREFPQPS